MAWLPPGYEMAEVVAANLCGGDKSFTGFDMSTKLKLIGVDVAVLWRPFCRRTECRVLTYEDTYKGVYKRINISSDGKYLLGGILVGEAEAYNLLLQTVNNRIISAAPAGGSDAGQPRRICGGRGRQHHDGPAGRGGDLFL